MDNEIKYPEQEAPEKNTDNAFVKVGEDGSPVMPSAKDKKTDIDENDLAKLDKRSNEK